MFCKDRRGYRLYLPVYISLMLLTVSCMLLICTFVSNIRNTYTAAGFDGAAEYFDFNVGMVCAAIILLILFFCLGFYFIFARREFKLHAELESRDRLFDLLTAHTQNVFLLYDGKRKRIDFATENLSRFLGTEDFNVWQDEDGKIFISGIHVNIYVTEELEKWDRKSNFATEIHEYIRPDNGEKQYISEKIYPIEPEEMYIIMLCDRTLEYQQEMALRLALENAENSSKAKSRFLSNISHDIRTPLNNIMGMTGLAEANINNEERVKDCLSKISISSDILLRLINSVLDMSRIESGHITISEEKMSLPDLLHDLGEILEPQAEAKNIIFTMGTSDIIDSEVLGDRIHLSQIFINIAGNAIKYTSPGGRVDIQIRQCRDKDTELAVFEFLFTDTGCGIKRDCLEKIYAPFERLEHPETMEVEGTGLGLSIAKQLVDIMGGSIEVKSKLGVGTRFIIRLSFKIPQPELAAAIVDGRAVPTVDIEEKRNTNLMEIRDKKILLVEDNDINREIVTETLGALGVFVQPAENGIQCIDLLEQCEDGTYDVILMDIQMPVLNGYETTKRIRASTREYLKRIPIIAMTANAFREDKEMATAAGMNDHISKPVMIHEFVRVLKQYSYKK